MRATTYFIITGVLSLLFSPSVMAHLTEPGGVLPHIFTGEHLLIMVIVGVCVVGIDKLYRRFRKIK